MRLIDADALKEAFYNRKRTPDDEKYLRVPVELVYQYIYNAPTMEMSLSLNNISDEDIEKFKLIWQRATSKGLQLVNERPQGKWVYDNMLNNWKCSECGETPKTIGYVGTALFMEQHFKFCNHCGADMKGGGE